jgi:hypothetical protein
MRRCEVPRACVLPSVMAPRRGTSPTSCVACRRRRTRPAGASPSRLERATASARRGGGLRRHADGRGLGRAAGRCTGGGPDRTDRRGADPVGRLRTLRPGAGGAADRAPWRHIPPAMRTSLRRCSASGRRAPCSMLPAGTGAPSRHRASCFRPTARGSNCAADGADQGRPAGRRRPSAHVLFQARWPRLRASHRDGRLGAWDSVTVWLQ